MQATIAIAVALLSGSALTELIRRFWRSDGDAAAVADAITAAAKRIMDAQTAQVEAQAREIASLRAEVAALRRQIAEQSAQIADWHDEREAVRRWRRQAEEMIAEAGRIPPRWHGPGG